MAMIKKSWNFYAVNSPIFNWFEMNFFTIIFLNPYPVIISFVFIFSECFTLFNLHHSFSSGTFGGRWTSWFMIWCRLWRRVQNKPVEGLETVEITPWPSVACWNGRPASGGAGSAGLITLTRRGTPATWAKAPNPAWRSRKTTVRLQQGALTHVTTTTATRTSSSGRSGGRLSPRTPGGGRGQFGWMT